MYFLNSIPRSRLLLLQTSALVYLPLLAVFVYLHHTSDGAVSVESIGVDTNHSSSEGNLPFYTLISKENVERMNETLLPLARAVVDDALGRGNNMSRLRCPPPDHNRYADLRKMPGLEDSPKLSYLFAIDLHQAMAILPSLLGAIIEAAKVLGPQNCALSIVEGRSTDGTFEVLQLFGEKLRTLGIKYYLVTSDIDPLSKDVDRIASLAELRNKALLPLTPDQFFPFATVIFLNDVSLCGEDILELILQLRLQEADMVCGMDWVSVGPEPTFYDVWVARQLNGDSFFRISDDGNWDLAWDLFWNSTAKEDFLKGKPFQVFSCWNGVTAFKAEPLWRGTKFRRNYEGECDECYQGEPQLFCKDLWNAGLKRIAVIPSVNVEYSDEGSSNIKATKGFVSNHVTNHERIVWQEQAPEMVKCIPDWNNQFWRPWDECLAFRN